MSETNSDYTFNQYADQARGFAKCPRVQVIVGDNPPVEAPWLYPILGLCGEAGELANKAKKVIRDEAGVLSSARNAQLQDELSDVLWYAAETARKLGAHFGSIAVANVRKLTGRLERGTIQGSGDNR